MSTRGSSKSSLKQQPVGDNFVVITGPHQRGKSERISKVRSHVAKHYHHQQRQRRWMLAANEAYLQPAYCGPENPVVGGLVRELAFIQIDPERLFVSQQVCLRLQQFVFQYLTTNAEFHPFFRTVIPASVIHVPMMSVKILSASFWDDLNSSTGEVTQVTLHQRRISMSILNESLTQEQEAINDVNIMALIAFLTYEWVDDNREAFHQHRRGIQDIIQRRGGIDQLGFDGLIKSSVIILEEFQKVIRGFSHPEPPTFPSPPLLNNFGHYLHHPPDWDVFTLSRIQQQDLQLSALVRRLLSYFYQLVVLPIEFSCHTTLTESRDTQQEIRTRWHAIYERFLITDQDPSSPFFSETEREARNDPRIKIIIQTALFFFTAGTKATCNAATMTYFRSLLQQTDISLSWSSLPGALIWCLVIGARVSQPDSTTRKWLLMQITRAVWPVAVLGGDTLTSLRIVLRGLDGMEDLVRNTRPFEGDWQ